MNTQLLCTFTTQHNLEQTIRDITKHFKIVFDKIYVLQNEDKTKELICTYNVEYIENFQEGIIDTISLHRKKQTNTLYTINALNEVIRSKNGGVLDKSFQVDWSEYQNSLLLTNDSGLNIIKTKIHKIINVNDWEVEY